MTRRLAFVVALIVWAAAAAGESADAPRAPGSAACAANGGAALETIGVSILFGLAGLWLLL